MHVRAAPSAGIRWSLRWSLRRSTGRGSSAALVALALVGAPGCYATHGLDVDAGTRDARYIESGLGDVFHHDAPPPDAWRPDAALPVSECARDLDCIGGLCVQDFAPSPVDLAPVPLRCAAAVGPVAPGTPCDSNDACDHGLCALAGGCVAPCVSSDDCAANERCARVPIVTGSTSLQFVQACVHWVDAPPGVEVSPVTAVAVSPFTSERVELDPMRGRTQLTLYVADERDDNRYVSVMTTREGAVVFDGAELGMRRQPLMAAAYGDVVPFLISNGDNDYPLGASFVAQLETGSTSSLHRIVMDRAAPGATLDLNLFYVGIAPPRGGEPPSNVRTMIQQLDALLGTFAVRVGEVRHVVVPGATATRFAVIDHDPEVQDLFTYSAGAARPAVNLFLVRSASEFLGVSGGAPGALAVHGTRCSGIAIAFEDVVSFLSMAPPGFLGTVVAHEFGHFAGLFHTTELDGTIVEPLSDTPECTLAAHDRDGDRMLYPDECLDAGADNVMFWGPFVPGAHFSPRQSQILQNAMVLR